MATTLDLTPFGFTATENIVYGRLISGGPASGYAVARDLVIARANAYQALRGLVAKGAAVVSDEDPPRYRAIRPADLFASIVNQQARKLDDLEVQLAADSAIVTESFIRLTGERAFTELAARAVARETGEIVCIGTRNLLAPLTPSFRKRLVDGSPTRIWALGEPPPLPFALEGTISIDRARQILGASVLILFAGSSVLLARQIDRSVSGYWASDPDVVAATRGAFLALISRPG